MGLRKAGWSVMLVWQCQLKKRDAIEARIGLPPKSFAEGELNDVA